MKANPNKKTKKEEKYYRCVSFFDVVKTPQDLKDFNKVYKKICEEEYFRTFVHKAIYGSISMACSDPNKQCKLIYNRWNPSLSLGKFDIIAYGVWHLNETATLRHNHNVERTKDG